MTPTTEATAAVTVKVRLTEVGKKRAADGSLSIHAGGCSYTFKPSDVLDIPVSDWATFVLPTYDAAGAPLFELAPAAAAPVVAGKTNQPAE